ncbi:MAG: hypothetical protein V5A13_11890 [Haloarculaceae archaeon]
MCADDLETVADSLGGDIVVAGPSEGPGAVETLAGGDGQLRVVGVGDTEALGDAVRDAGAVVVAMDGPSSLSASVRQAADAEDGFVVAVLDGQEDESLEPARLGRVREGADVTLLACRGHRPEGSPSGRSDAAETQFGRAGSGAAVGGAFEFARMLDTPGQINLDLADARTVLTDGALAVLAGGTASFETESPGRAVQRAFEGIPPSVDVTGGSGALVSVAGGPEMSIDDAVAAVRTVRRELGPTENLIWGVAVEEALADQLTVDIVVDDVHPPLSAGDSCRRCGAALAAYTFGDRTTLACEACGFADLSVSLGDWSDHDAGN